MKASSIRFNVELARQTDAGIQKLADAENRSKTNFCQVLFGRLIRVAETRPDELKKLGLIKDEAECQT